MSIEPGYETGDALTGVATTPYMVRRNAWWSFLSGAMGLTYGGNRATWNIGEGGANKWQSYVQNLDGARHQGVIRAVAEQYNWQDLVPDFNNSVLSSGSNSGSDLALAGASASGNLIVAYTPSSRTLSINMAKLSGSSNAFWYDPASGTKQNAGSALANSGTRQFTTPGNNSYGDSDWILVISK
jgi:hypothetical protein